MNPNIPSNQFLAEAFEFEFCEECSGDAEHHTAVPIQTIGVWFARCDYPPDKNGSIHEVILNYRYEFDPGLRHEEMTQ